MLEVDGKQVYWNPNFMKALFRATIEKDAKTIRLWTMKPNKSIGRTIK